GRGELAGARYRAGRAGGLARERGGTGAALALLGGLRLLVGQLGVLARPGGHGDSFGLLGSEARVKSRLAGAEVPARVAAPPLVTRQGGKARRSRLRPAGDGRVMGIVSIRRQSGRRKRSSPTARAGQPQAKRTELDPASAAASSARAGATGLLWLAASRVQR